MAENFNLIFGSQAPETASWSDADYQTGWNTVGSTPPTAEQFDALQNRSDKKSQELNNRLSPLERKAREQGRQAGTAYTVGAAVTVDRLPADWLLVCTKAGKSGTAAITLPNPLIDGATITDGTITWKLRKVATNGGLGYRQPSTDYTVGQIAYHASLPTGYYLKCTTAGTTGSGNLTISGTVTPNATTVADGTVVWTVSRDLPLIGGGALTGTNLTWNANDLGGSAIVAKSLGVNGYIKYASGLIVQWGKSHPTISNGYATIYYPINFTTTRHVAATSSGTIVSIKSIDNTGFAVYQYYATSSGITTTPVAPTSGDIEWIAIGY